jgi:hypothetical protein
MATHYANGKTTTSGLVFMYDTIDKENCYKGEPTTNLVDYSEYQYLADNYTAALGGWDTFEGNFLIDVINKVPGYTNRSIKMTSVQANVYKYHFNVPLTSGQTYTVSFWGKATSAGNYGNFLLADGPSGYLVFEPGGYSSVTTEFTRFTYTFVVPSTGTYNFATYLYGDGQVVWLSGFQLENKSHATQYLPSNGAATLRSATQGLLDLTNTNQIDLSNVSFDANAQINFDGTNDYVNIGTNSSLAITGDMTICAWVYINNFSATYNSIIGKTTSGGMPAPYDYYTNINTGKLVFLRGNGSIYAYTTSIASPALNAWQFVAVTTSGITITHYLNGETNGVGTASTTIADNGDNALIGSRGDYVTKMNGKISTLQIYNRALTQTEVTQNYNATKSRFNLA